MARIVRADQHIGGGTRVRLRLVALEGGEGPQFGLGGATAQGTGREAYMDAQVEGEPVPQQEGAMKQQKATGGSWT